MPKPGVEYLSEQILRYLLKHPEAGDSMEGIAEWWLMLQRIEDEVDNVKAALDFLVSKGLVEVEGGADSRRLYRLKPERKDALADLDPDSKVFG